jgi:hypothetical protein
MGGTLVKIRLTMTNNRLVDLPDGGLGNRIQPASGERGCF